MSDSLRPRGLQHTRLPCPSLSLGVCPSLCLLSWWWTGRPGVLRFMGSQRVGHDWATELKWVHNRNARRECSPERDQVSTLILDSGFHSCEKTNFCCLRHVVCGMLLWWPKQTNTQYEDSHLQAKERGLRRNLPPSHLHLKCLFSTSEKHSCHEPHP